MTAIGGRLDRAVHRRVEARPAGAALELRVRREQLLAATGAAERARALFLVQRDSCRAARCRDTAGRCTAVASARPATLRPACSRRTSSDPSSSFCRSRRMGCSISLTGFSGLGPPGCRIESPRGPPLPAPHHLHCPPPGRPWCSPRQFFFATPPGPRSLRAFDPDRTAALELDMWQAYYAKAKFACSRIS